MRRARRRPGVRVEVARGIAVLTIDRPGARNAIDLDTVSRLHAALEALAADPRVRVLILTGGGRAFVSGADIRQLRDRQAADALLGINSSLFLRVERFPSPTVAAIEGFALGGGCELALACDLRVAGASARFGQPEVGLGIIPAAGATYRLPRVVGQGRARELILTGRIIDTAEALRIGMVTRVVPDGGALAGARALAATIASRSPLALRIAKLALAASAYGAEPGYLAECLGQGILFGSADKREGMNAFLQGRRPRFRGR